MCPWSERRLLAAAWGSRLHVVEGGGHLNSESRLGDWPEGYGLLGGERPPIAAMTTLKLRPARTDPTPAEIDFLEDRLY